MLSISEVEGPVRQVSGDLRREGLKDFWVQIHNLPLMCMNRRMAKFLAEQIGTVVELPADSRECMGRFIRVKVRIDISKPLMRCVRLNVDDPGEIITAILLYEKLPEFCYACGIVGHGLRDCPDDNARTEALEGATTKYGSWLRAASLEQAKNRASRKEIKGPENTPSSSNQDDHSGKSSETGKSSKNNSNDQEGSLRKDIQTAGALKSAIDRDMEMTESEYVSSQGQGDGEPSYIHSPEEGGIQVNCKGKSGGIVLLWKED
ncbi:hypothetical protein EZV62_008352 [Acer yangbiense]|uniref:CCHC-type domain-containing protein n=1 Tax=Acer yangbiense TaxID=1000413 RepID=A0A5C7ICW8_9ROSI|nr:hypothetical protein EZV62_008352 [Acer yangbiense]